MAEDQEDYGGVKDVIDKFQNFVLGKLIDESYIGENGSLTKLQIDTNQEQSMLSIAKHQDEEYANQSIKLIPGNKNYLPEFMEEINNFIMGSTYKNLFAQKRMSVQDQAFQGKLEEVGRQVTQVYEQHDDENMAINSIAIQELQKMEK